MKKNFILILGLIIIIVASVLSKFTDIPALDVGALIAAAAGFAMTVVSTYNKSEKKSVKEILTIILLSVGTILLIFAGQTEETVMAIYTGVIGLVVLIMGILSGVFSFKKIDKPKE